MLDKKVDEIIMENGKFAGVRSGDEVCKSCVCDSPRLFASSGVWFSRCALNEGVRRQAVHRIRVVQRPVSILIHPYFHRSDTYV